MKNNCENVQKLTYTSSTFFDLLHSISVGVLYSKEKYLSPFYKILYLISLCLIPFVFVPLTPSKKELSPIAIASRIEVFPEPLSPIIRLNPFSKFCSSPLKL